jgi:hypothetical protein
MCCVVCTAHLVDYFLEELQHPLNKIVVLCIGGFGHPYVILFVAHHHECDFGLYALPHLASELNQGGLHLSGVCGFGGAHVLVLELQFVAEVAVDELAVVQVGFILGYLERL